MGRRLARACDASLYCCLVGNTTTPGVSASLADIFAPGLEDRGSHVKVAAKVRGFAKIQGSMSSGC
jgi:hypothetical protein